MRVVCGSDLPHGVSPDCQDVIFSNGNVATRPGLQALFGPLAGNMVIADNPTTSLTVDFSDAILLAGTNIDDLFKLIGATLAALPGSFL